VFQESEEKVGRSRVCLKKQSPEKSAAMEACRQGSGLFSGRPCDEAASGMTPGLVVAKEWLTMDIFDDLFASATEDSFSFEWLTMDIFDDLFASATEDWSSVVETVKMKCQDDIDRKRKREEGGNGELGTPADDATQEKRSKLDIFVNNGNLALLASEDSVQQDSLHSTNCTLRAELFVCLYLKLLICV